MYRHGIVDKDGRVVNVIVWDGVTEWQPPKDHTVIRHDEIDMHDHWCHEKKEITKHKFMPKECMPDQE